MLPWRAASCSIEHHFLEAIEIAAADRPGRPRRVQIDDGNAHEDGLQASGETSAVDQREDCGFLLNYKQ